MLAASKIVSQLGNCEELCEGSKVVQDAKDEYHSLCQENSRLEKELMVAPEREELHLH